MVAVEVEIALGSVRSRLDVADEEDIGAVMMNVNEHETSRVLYPSWRTYSVLLLPLPLYAWLHTEDWGD